MQRVCTCRANNLSERFPAECICGKGPLSREARRGLCWLAAALGLAGALMAAGPPAKGHESWISRGGHRNGAGEWCCGVGDCFVVPKEHVFETRNGYVLVFGPVLGAGPAYHELVPFAEAQPSPDGEFWRCQRPDRSRRCFFAPPPST